jgi:hypothetical protein
VLTAVLQIQLLLMYVIVQLLVWLLVVVPVLGMLQGGVTVVLCQQVIDSLSQLLQLM